MDSFPCSLYVFLLTIFFPPIQLLKVLSWLIPLTTPSLQKPQLVSPISFTSTMAKVSLPLWGSGRQGGACISTSKNSLFLS